MPRLPSPSRSGTPDAPPGEPPLTSPDDRLRAALADRYQFERELGGGGMSRVFVARETALGREVVIKVVADALTAGVGAARFAREIAVAARLQQANIVPVLAAGEVDGHAYYAMPYVRGESLRHRLAGGAPLSLAERLSILRDVARALAYAHGEGVVHRDIKPENVLLSHGTAVVTDFGIAKALTALATSEGADAATGATLTQAGGSIGTPAYMAPEQAVGSAVDRRADLYAWGVLGYELLAGAHPFAQHTTPQRLIAAHITETPAPLVGRAAAVPAAVAAIIMQCLEKDPERRPASATDLLAALDSAATPVPVVERPRARMPARMPAALAGVVLLFLLLAAGLWARRHRPGGAGGGAADNRSLAVLPLANLSGDQADDFFGIGLAEEITRALAQNGVRVIGRTSAAALQAKGMDERAIAAELGVGSLLTGSVQRAAGQVRITVTLLSAGDGAVRWTERYDRPLANIFAVQDEIARQVATTLLGSLGPAGAGLTARVETTDPETHALVLQGMVLFNRRGAKPLQQAIALFQRAAKRDPGYARAEASLAMALAVLPAYVVDSSPPILAAAVAAADRAIALDSTIPESYTALGYAYSLLGQLDRAEASLRRALALDSTMATAWGWYGLLANRRGEYAAAHERVARAHALEPASLIAPIWEAQVLDTERRYAAAESVASATIALDSTFMLAWNWRVNALLGLGRLAEAVALAEQGVARSSEMPRGLLAYCYAVAGRRDDALRVIAAERAQGGGRLPATGALAAALEQVGRHEEAVTLLTAAIARHDVWVVQFPHSARYDALRRDPRVAEMLARLQR